MAKKIRVEHIFCMELLNIRVDDELVFSCTDKEPGEYGGEGPVYKATIALLEGLYGKAPYWWGDMDVQYFEWYPE